MSSAPNSLENVKITYFGIGGRAQPIYYLLEDAGVPYERVEVNPGNRTAYEAGKFDFALYPFNQLPTVQVNGTVIAQQDAILRYMADVLGYAPTSFEDRRIVDMLACSLEDLKKSYNDAVYSEDPKSTLPAYVASLPKIFAQYEYLLSTSKGPKGSFVASAPEGKPTFPEFTLLHLLTGALVLSPSSLDAFPLLSTWIAKLNGRENIKAYVESGRKPVMLNDCQAAQEKICA